MKVKVPKSKRISAARLHKAEKLARRSKSQKARLARKNPDMRKKMKKDPGIPNLYPFKAELLTQMEEAKRMEREERVRKAAEAAVAHDEKMGIVRTEEEMKLLTKGDTSRRQFLGLFNKVVESADVVLEVLDARDPMACRCFEAEKAVRDSSGKKKLVLVLNKIDLVPQNVLNGWISYLRGEFPTIAFKASTQGKSAPSQSDENARRGSEAVIQHTSEAVGVNALMQLLKNYCRSDGAAAGAKSITVGVIGYPNVGKSSIINSLKRARAVGVSPVPGFTREVSEVRLDKQLRLLDSPGVFFEGSDGAWETASKAPILLMCLQADKVDPEEAVTAVLEKVPASSLLSLYSIGTWMTTREFLTRVAQRRGKLKKGGVPDPEAAAKVVLADVAAGKIPFYVEAPVRQGVHLDAQIVSQYDKVLDLDADKDEDIEDDDDDEEEEDDDME